MLARPLEWPSERAAERSSRGAGPLTRPSASERRVCGAIWPSERPPTRSLARPASFAGGCVCLCIHLPLFKSAAGERRRPFDLAGPNWLKSGAAASFAARRLARAPTPADWARPSDSDAPKRSETDYWQVINGRLMTGLVRCAAPIAHWLVRRRRPPPPLPTRRSAARVCLSAASTGSGGGGRADGLFAQRRRRCSRQTNLSTGRRSRLGDARRLKPLICFRPPPPPSSAQVRAGRPLNKRRQRR